MHCGSCGPARSVVETDFFSQVITACGALSSACCYLSTRYRAVWSRGESYEMKSILKRAYRCGQNNEDQVSSNIVSPGTWARRRGGRHSEYSKSSNSTLVLTPGTKEAHVLLQAMVLESNLHWTG